jgi:predicted GNAT superfamily acetyltransferase
LPLEGSVLLVEIPPAIQRIKERRPTLARLWRAHTRDIFERAFDAGYMVTDFIYLRGERVPRSYYVLSHGERTLG